MLEEKMNETPEEVFFRYSADCAQDLFSIGLIDEQTFRKIKEYREKGIIPEKSFLEVAYPNAIARIKRLADSLEMPYWDIGVIRRYFLEEHNKVIGRGEGLYKDASPTIRELCKVKVGKIIRKEDNGQIIYDIDYGEKVGRVIGRYLPRVNIGERISTHWKFAIEKI